MNPGSTDGGAPVVAPFSGTVVALSVAPGDRVSATSEVVVLEAMKMEHAVVAGYAGLVTALAVDIGASVSAGQTLAFVAATGTGEEDADEEGDEIDLDRVRPDLTEAAERHRIGLDEGRPAAVARRHAMGRRTARENVADLVDPGSFVEYGALAVAAQRRRRSEEELVEQTPADGLVTGTATVEGVAVAVMAYDYTVLAGTQGFHSHRKADRLLGVVRDRRLPLVIFAEGGGGRPGDTDVSAVAQLDVPTFGMLAGLAGQVPLVAVVAGYCFAGNAALVSCCDVVVATRDSNIGMGGPAMIEGGGLGTVRPEDIGPADVQYANGVVDILVSDEAEATSVARRCLSYLGGHEHAGEAPDQRILRHLVPENRVRAYDVRAVIDALFDVGSVLELRGGFGAGIVTSLARLDGRPVGVMANNPFHLGGAIDGDGADKATRFLTLCSERGLPVVSLCDTPGFMVGPESERTGTVRRFGAMFVAGARLSTPLVTVVLRKAYGLGAQAMAGGSLHAPRLAVAWPSGEFGGMGIEGAVRLGFRKELETIADPAAREARYDELVAGYYERGKALGAAAVFEIDDVIDPAQTRATLARVL